MNDLEKRLDEILEPLDGGHLAWDEVKAKARTEIHALMLESKHPSIYETAYSPESEMHHVLFAYGEVCEKDGVASERAVKIRMDMAVHFHDLRKMIKGGDK